MNRKNIGDTYPAATSKMTPSKVLNTLAKHGIIVSEDEVEIILEFMQRVAKLTVNRYLKNVEKDFTASVFLFVYKFYENNLLRRGPLFV